MQKKLPIWDQRLLLFMDHCIANKLAGIDNQGSFLKLLNITATATIKQIRDGKQSFRHQHILIVAKKFSVSTDWIFGLTDEMYRTDKKETVESLLQQALLKLKSKK